MRLLVILILAACTSARSGRATSTAATCAPVGSALYGIDDQVFPDSHEAASRLRIYPNGAWTFEQERGCLQRADVDRIKAALDRATWMQFPTPGKCRPGSRSTFYFVDGSAVYESTCAARLDEPTARAVAEIDAIIQAARARSK